MKVSILAGVAIVAVSMISADLATAGGSKSSKQTWQNAGRTTARASGPQVRGFRSGIGGYSYIYNDTLNFDSDPEIHDAVPTGPNRLFDSTTTIDGMWWDQ